MIATMETRAFPWIVFVWFGVFAIAQFRLFRCPHCGKLAIFTPSGWSTPFVGDKCRYCGREY